MATTTTAALLRLRAFGVVVSTEATIAASSCLDGVTALPRSLLSKKPDNQLTCDVLRIPEYMDRNIPSWWTSSDVLPL